MHKVNAFFPAVLITGASQVGKISIFLIVKKVHYITGKTGGAINKQNKKRNQKVVL